MTTFVQVPAENYDLHNYVIFVAPKRRVNAEAVEEIIFSRIATMAVRLMSPSWCGNGNIQSPWSVKATLFTKALFSLSLFSDLQ